MSYDQLLLLDDTDALLLQLGRDIKNILRRRGIYNRLPGYLGAEYAQHGASTWDRGEIDRSRLGKATGWTCVFCDLVHLCYVEEIHRHKVNYVTRIRAGVSVSDLIRLCLAQRLFRMQRATDPIGWAVYNHLRKVLLTLLEQDRISLQNPTKSPLARAHPAYPSGFANSSLIRVRVGSGDEASQPSAVHDLERAINDFCQAGASLPALHRGDRATLECWAAAICALPSSRVSAFLFGTLVGIAKARTRELARQEEFDAVTAQLEHDVLLTSKLPLTDAQADLPQESRSSLLMKAMTQLADVDERWSQLPPEGQVIGPERTDKAIEQELIGCKVDVPRMRQLILRLRHLARFPTVKPPSLESLANELGVKTKASVHNYLHRLTMILARLLAMQDAPQ